MEKIDNIKLTFGLWRNFQGLFHTSALLLTWMMRLYTIGIKMWPHTANA